MQEVFFLLGDELEVYFAGVVVTANLHSHGTLQQPVIADCGKGVAAKAQLPHDAKQVGMLSLDHSSQRVLLYVADHIRQLSFTHEHGVVVTGGKERRTFRSLAARKRAGSAACCARRIIIRRTERSGRHGRSRRHGRSGGRGNSSGRRHGGGGGRSSLCCILRGIEKKGGVEFPPCF